MLLSKVLGLPIVVLLALSACNTQSQRTDVEPTKNQPMGVAATESTPTYQVKNVDLTGVSFPAVHIVSPTRYQYFLYIFDNSGVFDSVGNGYIDEGLEIRVQREFDLANKGEAVASLLISATTVFLLPAYSNVVDSHNFSVYFDGKHIKDFEYQNERANFMSLFSMSGSISDDTIMRKVDEFVVKTFLKELHESEILGEYPIAEQP